MSETSNTTHAPTNTPSPNAPADAQGYWRANVRIIIGCLVVWAVVSLGFAVLLRPALMGISFMGTDLGLWFGQQGAILTFVALIFFYAWRMNKLDKQYGVEED
ncbi:DUF4212 domain-containing protein [Moraxella bovis]|uniref:DUF4212 domain-containing protein n=1 Tax=Moraxella bovis TaxID=476 RepID=UPI0022261C29|nr:DUF4212 domain-containing protein [Moraxella bovis]UYZ68692.1 DUF4212 domain-containing protein [Moraxella bovis]UYZ71068.1 DUF4212 domain-containing protein [Moraxella bovis]UYZ73014.1 DUF4212 domain-containing protein [Moraxella bovis]UZA14363.1 DUF4212 domain-containing protein [Moraxella bovis]UZA27277.1 DUF4212 domain-containing protein [Moraxella bovis]